jgi:hypothetical protein
MSFKQYVMSRRITDTPTGDFVADARRDPRLPDVASWGELRRYLEWRTGSGSRDLVIAAARTVWDGYQRSLRR